MTNSAPVFEGFVILELLGRRVLAGYLTEQEIAGQGFLRLEIPEVDDQPPATQFYAPSAVYCITPTTEEIARSAARGRRPQPVNRWELEPPRARHDDDAPETSYEEDDESEGLL